MELDDFLQKMHDAGGLDSSGRFTVAGKEAAARFATFADSIPHFILLRLVQAAVCAGAEALQVHDTGVRFVGGQWSPSDLSTLTGDLGRALTAPEHTALHHLAVALGASLREGDVTMRVPSPGRLEVFLPSPVKFVPVDLLLAAPLRVSLTGLPLDTVFGSFKPDWQLPDDCLAELARGRPLGHGIAPMSARTALFRPKGTHSTRAWTGLVLRHWQDLGDPPAMVADEVVVPKTHLALCVGPRPTRTRVGLVKYGVLIQQWDQPWNLPVPEVLVEADDLPVDLSGLKPVQSPELEERLLAVRPLIEEALRDARTHVATLKPPSGGAPEWVSYACMAAGLGLGLVTWQPSFPIVGMTLSAWLFGHGGHRQQMARRTRLLAEALNAPS